MTETITEALADIQRRLHVPKDKKNDFGGYNYRNAEGIIAAFKALNVEGAALTLSDEMQEVGGQIFVTATATITIGGESVSAQGHAMHQLTKKGMDAAQITGSASSYARKYALGGLLAIEDETQDPDSRDNRKENGQTKPPAPKVRQEEAAILEDMANRAGSDRAAIFQAMKIEGESWADLPEQYFEKVRNGIQAKLDKIEQDHDAAVREQ